MATIRIQSEDFDAAAEAATLTSGRRDVGAVVTFTGLCRDEAGRLNALELGRAAGARRHSGRDLARGRRAGTAAACAPSAHRRRRQTDRRSTDFFSHGVKHLYAPRL